MATTNLLDLPNCMLELVLSYLTFDEIAKNRLVCVRFDKLCQSLLNRGFTKMMKRHAAYLKRIKMQLPRRESERRNHPLARHADILTCIETRISMLSMTYTKYMELNLCCFIPGKVIDEVLHLLKLVKECDGKLRAHEVLQELRDISSMAIEHFDEKVANPLKKSFLDINTLKLTGGYNHLMMDQNLASPYLINTSTPMMRSKTPAGDDSQESVSTSSAVQKLELQYMIASKRISRLTHANTKLNRKLDAFAIMVSSLKRRIDESDAKTRELVKSVSQLKGGDVAGPSVNRDVAAAAAAATVGGKRSMRTRAATIIKRRIAEKLSEDEKASNEDIHMELLMVRKKSKMSDA